MRGNARSVEGGADIGTRCNFVRMLIVGRNGSIEKKSEYLYRGEKLGRGWGRVIAAMIGKGAFDFVLHLCPFRFNSLSHFAPFYSLHSHLLESSLSIFRCVRGRLALRTKVFLLNRSPRWRNEIFKNNSSPPSPEKGSTGCLFAIRFSNLVAKTSTRLLLRFQVALAGYI